jgi:hypothetical protein
MITQTTAEIAMCKERSMSGSAKTTIVVSTAAISTPITTTTTTTRFRLRSRGGAR